MTKSRKIIYKMNATFYLLLFLLALTDGMFVSDDEDFSLRTTSNDKHLLPNLEVAIPAKRVFRFAFNPNLFQWKTPESSMTVDQSVFSYHPSISGLPDLPYWMRYKYSQRHKTGFIYGVPPVSHERHFLDVVATNKANFETGILKLIVNVTSSAGTTPKHDLKSVRLKIDNLNLEDIFDSHRLRNLKSIFKQHLWPQSSDDLHLTFIASSLDDGYRRPIIPSLKDGVILQLSSRANFSRTLLELNFETSPLRAKFQTCPRDFKRTSVERHFREKGFAIDWCAFRLFRILHDGTTQIIPDSGDSQETVESPKETYPSLYEDTINTITIHKIPLHDPLSARHLFPRRDAVPRRNLSNEFLSSIVPAIILFVMLAITFGLLLCFKRQGEREEHWRGFVESFFLVIQDAVTCCKCCCCKNKKKEVVQNPLINTQRKFQVRLSKSGVQQDDPLTRHRRASSVQRQTDTLKRLAQKRDITPRLQNPIVGPDGSGSPNDSMFMARGFDDSTLGSRNGSPGYRSSTQRDVLDNLERPLPPPYAPHTTSMYCEDDGTYLV